MVTRGSHRVAFGSATRELQPAMPNECSVDVTCHRVPTRELQPGGWTRSPDRFILSLRAHARVATCEGSSGRNAVQTVTACPRASCNYEIVSSNHLEVACHCVPTRELQQVAGDIATETALCHCVPTRELQHETP